MKKYIIALLVLVLPVLGYAAQRTVPWNINTTTNVVWPYGNPDSTVKVGIGTTAPSSDLEIARETPMFKLLDNSSTSFATFSVSNTTLSILFGLNGAEIPASITSDGSTIVFSPTGVGGLTFAIDSLSFLSGFAGINAVDYTFKADPATGGSNLNGGDFIISSGNSTGTGTSDIHFRVTGGGSSGSTIRPAYTITTINQFGLGVGTTTSLAHLQVTASSTNATTTIQFGKANQNKGVCRTEYDTAGSPVYIYIAAGATAYTFQNGGTPPSGCTN